MGGGCQGLLCYFLDPENCWTSHPFDTKKAPKAVTSNPIRARGRKKTPLKQRVLKILRMVMNHPTPKTKLPCLRMNSTIFSPFKKIKNIM